MRSTALVNPGANLSKDALEDPAKLGAPKNPLRIIDFLIDRFVCRYLDMPKSYRTTCGIPLLWIMIYSGALILDFHTDVATIDFADYIRLRKVKIYAVETVCYIKFWFVNC